MNNKNAFQMLAGIFAIAKNGIVCSWLNNKWGYDRQDLIFI
jgi:hypothetical protein